MEAYLSHNVFELTKLNLEFENCLNPANASGFVILNRYELKFPHNANAGNEFLSIVFCVKMNRKDVKATGKSYFLFKN